KTVLTTRIVIYANMISYFFFQAEDGIRDGHVTGVQTCALPISSRRKARSRAMRARGTTCTLRIRKMMETTLITRSTCGSPKNHEIGRASCRERVYITGVADTD